MIAAVDGIIYRLQRRGGISRLYSEILPRMCALDPALTVRLFADGPCLQALPAHRRIRHLPPPAVYRWLGGSRVGRRLVPHISRASARLALRPPAGIWHSTYYTTPASGSWAAVVTVLDMIHERFADIFSGPAEDAFRARKRACIERAAAIVCISETTRSELLACSAAAAGKSIHVVPLGCSPEFRVRERPSQPRRFILYVGDRAGAHKNFGRCLEAFDTLSRTRDVELVAAGRAWTASECADLSRRGLASKVRLIVDPDDRALADLYNAAALVVYPSLAEGFGIPLVEAMACGCPIVASRIPATLEVAGPCAVYFDPLDVPSQVEALAQGLDARSERGRLDAGLERARRYSWDRAAAGMLEVYRSVSPAA